MNENPNAFWQRALLILGAIIVLLLVGRAFFIPESWGELGYYRANAVLNELQRPMVHGENRSCKECHENVYEIKEKSMHRRLSCESCHAPIVTHVDGDKKIADMTTAQGGSIDELCLSCHKEITGRASNFPMIQKERHLKSHDVSMDNSCNQCHTVHAPLENILKAIETRSLAEEISR